MLSQNLVSTIIPCCSNLAWDDLITLQVQVDKKNLMEFLLDFSILLVQLLHGLCTVFPHPSCDINVTWCCDTCDVTLSCTPSCVVSPKEKKKKRNINNDLVILPSHDNIIMQYNLHDPSTRPCNTIINSFVHFLADNPTAFSFNNGWRS